MRVLQRRVAPLQQACTLARLGTAQLSTPGAPTIGGGGGGASSGGGNTVAACVMLGFGAGALSATATRPAAAAACYLVASAAGYCLRRGILRSWSSGEKLGASEVLRRHFLYEPDWHTPDRRRDGGDAQVDRFALVRGRALHAAHVGAWTLCFLPVYPALELSLFPLGLASFYFYYPKARGAGIVVDSRERRRAGARGTAAQVLRLDWHRFEINVGKAYPPPNTGRHPPAVTYNLPHLDLPTFGVRHWPWRQHFDRLKPLLVPRRTTP